MTCPLSAPFLQNSYLCPQRISPTGRGVWVVSTTLVFGKRERLPEALPGPSEALGSASSSRTWTSPTHVQADLEPFHVTSLWAMQGAANSKTAFPGPPFLRQSLASGTPSLPTSARAEWSLLPHSNDTPEEALHTYRVAHIHRPK